MSWAEQFELIWPKLRFVNYNATMSDDDGNSEKLFSMLVLGVGSLAAGMLPAIVPKMSRKQLPITTSLLLCMGAGILLATSLVHILPEARAQLLSTWAEIVFCVGFFVMYLIDEFVHLIYGGAHHQYQQEQNNKRYIAAFSTQYGACNENETQALLRRHSLPSRYLSEEHHRSHGNVVFRNTNHDLNLITRDQYDATNIEKAHPRQADVNVRNCHNHTTKPNMSSTLSNIGLLTALLLHSIIEGLAIGVQISSAKVLFLLGAVSCHKFVMGFCLGLEFRVNSQTNITKHLIFVSLFALGAVSGIAIGIVLVKVSGNIMSKSLSVIQAVAGGTLLYITVCEVMPREKNKWQEYQFPQYKVLGLIQFVSIAVGFAIMCVINFYLNDDI